MVPPISSAATARIVFVRTPPRGVLRSVSAGPGRSCQVADHGELDPQREPFSDVGMASFAAASAKATSPTFWIASYPGTGRRHRPSEDQRNALSRPSPPQRDFPRKATDWRRSYPPCVRCPRRHPSSPCGMCRPRVHRASRHVINAVRARGEATRWPCRRGWSWSFSQAGACTRSIACVLVSSWPVSRRGRRHRRSFPAAQRPAGGPKRRNRAGRARLASHPTGCTGRASRGSTSGAAPRGRPGSPHPRTRSPDPVPAPWSSSWCSLVKISCRADRAPRQGNHVEVTDTRDVIPGGQGTGHQQIGHPAKAIPTSGKVTDDRRHVFHPASLRA